MPIPFGLPAGLAGQYGRRQPLKGSPVTSSAPQHLKVIGGDEALEYVEAEFDAAEVLAECDLVVLATVDGTPHLHGPELPANRPVVLHLSGAEAVPGPLARSQGREPSVSAQESRAR